MKQMWAPAMALAAGVASSFGPCLAPRFVAIASLTAEGPLAKRALRLGSFVSGICCGYITLGTIGGALALAAAYSAYVYAALALGLIAGGILTIARPAHAGCRSSGHAKPKVASGAAFAAGFGFTAVSSPCCGPVVATLAGMSVASGSVASAALMLGAFAFGHAVPLAALATGSLPFGRALRSPALAPASATVGGGLMVALGSYYALLS